MGVHHFGHALLTRELQGLLVETAKASGGPTTIVVLTSNTHFYPYPEGVRLSEAEINNLDTFVSSLS